MTLINYSYWKTSQIKLITQHTSPCDSVFLTEYVPSSSRTIKVFLSSGLSGIYRRQKKTKLGFFVSNLTTSCILLNDSLFCNFTNDDKDDDDMKLYKK